MITILNLHLMSLMRAIDELYPSLEVKVVFGLFDGDKENGAQTRFFIDADGRPTTETPIIVISPFQDYQGVVESLAHEVSHAVAGYEHRHDEVWAEILTRISDKYLEIQDADDRIATEQTGVDTVGFKGESA